MLPGMFRPDAAERRAFAGYGVLFLVANLTLVIGLRHATWDADGAFCPNQMLVSDHARDFRFLLWNPWIDAGSPDGVDPQVGAFSPINVVWGLLAGGSETAFRWYWLSLWFAAGAGMFVLTRHWRVPAWGCSVAASAFAFSGFFVGHASHTTFLHAYCALPWILWRIDVAFARGTIGPAFQAGAIWGLSGLGGYPGVFVANALFVGGWVIGRAVQHCGMRLPSSDNSLPPGPGPDAICAARRPAHFALLTVAVFAGTGAIVVSPTYVGYAVETQGFSSRSGPLPREYATTSNAMSPFGVATWTSPHLATHRLVDESPFWEQTSPSSLGVHVGSVATWLAVLALVCRSNSGWRWWLVGLGLCGVALAVGNLLPFRGWLYDLCPPTRYFRHSAIFRGYLTLILPALAALACRDIAQYVEQRTTVSDRLRLSPGALRGSCLLVAASSALVYALALWTIPQHFKGVGLATIHVVIAWGGVAVIGILGHRFLREGQMRAFVRTILIVVSVDVILGMQVGRNLVSCQHSTSNDPWRKVAELRETSLDLTTHGLKRQLKGPIGHNFDNKNIPIRIASLWGYQPLMNQFHIRWARDSKLAPMAASEHRIWFSKAEHVARIRPSNVARDAFLERSRQAGGIPLVMHTADTNPTESADGDHALGERDAAVIRNLPVAQPVDVKLIDYEPVRMEFTVDVPSDGHLLVTDRWARGWKASVNGQAVPIEVGAFIFRAVPVVQGRNHVLMTYRPFGFPWLTGLSWGTMALVATGPALRRRLRHRMRRPATDVETAGLCGVAPPPPRRTAA